MRTTVVASVFEPAADAVSRMRTTSPPILLGRKLLKKVDQIRGEEGPAGDANRLSPQDQPPPPRSNQERKRVEEKADQQPARRRRASVSPKPSEVHA
jgi:hypothetical protein